MGMMHFKGDETEKEIILLAYGMESGLEDFYVNLAERSEDGEVTEVLNKLSRIEETHQQKLFDLYQTLESWASDRKAFELQKIEQVMEGGFTTKEFLEKQKDTMKNVPDVLSIAMMLEAQALDLYLRFSQRISDEKSKNVLYHIADEEKAHLELLGRLMEQKA